MQQSGRRTLLELKMFVDLAICAAALLWASGVVTHPFWRKQTLLLHHPFLQLLLVILLACGWHLSLVIAGMYRSFRLSGFKYEALTLARGTGGATLLTGIWLGLHIIAGLGQVTWSQVASSELLLFACGCYTLLLVSRLSSRLITLSLRTRGRNLRHVLIVGSNRRAIHAADLLTTRSSLGYRLVGFVDDGWHGTDDRRDMLVGDLASVPHLLRTLALDEVIVALPIASCYEIIRTISRECMRQGILVRCEASLFDPEGVQPKRGLEQLQLVTLHGSTWNEGAVFLKRVLDLSVSASLLCLLSPLLLVIGLAIRFTSPGPVFFLQERLGLGKRTFRIFKFRTMVANAEKLLGSLEHLNETGGPNFKVRNDPRITGVGSFLRKTSLDELPQLINVLLGDMSLVGPRPLPLRDYHGFSEDWHRRRFCVKPGITCLWQIMGRNTISFDRWMELDISYIDTWTLWLDLQILFRTIPVVIRGSGAM